MINRQTYVNSTTIHDHLKEINKLASGAFGALQWHIKKLSDLLSNKICIEICDCTGTINKKILCDRCEYAYCFKCCIPKCDWCVDDDNKPCGSCPKCNSTHRITSKSYCSSCAYNKIKYGELYYCYDCKKFITGFKHSNKYKENVIYSDQALDPEDIKSGFKYEKKIHNVELGRHINTDLLIKMFPEHEDIFIKHITKW